MARVLISCLLGIFLAGVLALSVSAQTVPQLTLLDIDGNAITGLTDGDTIRLAIDLPEALRQPTSITFFLEGEAEPLGACQILPGRRRCVTTAIAALGWYWNMDGEVQLMRTIVARARPRRVAALEVAVSPRPVVMVHGYASSASAWDEYLGPGGYLALMGLPGFAVGDGQVTGTMHTGNLLMPGAATHTLAQNAAILGEYIANVKELTGAEQVDLVVHSMGGLIARYYIDRIMTRRDVAQLIMLGTPNGGSDCAVLPNSLNLFQPASLELRSNYIRQVFNAQITERREVPFYLFAGTPIQRRVLSPCSATPNDLVVSLASATAIPVTMAEVPILHVDLNRSEELFTRYVAPLLRKTATDFANSDDPVATGVAPETNLVQFSQIYTGVVSSKQSNEHIIHIDNDVAVASFGLYDPSRTLTVTVRGASGNVIVLTEQDHGLTLIDDPATLVYLGYGFENPRPGPWRVTVHATERTPPLGTAYAIVTQYEGGARIAAELSNHLPGLDEVVALRASLLVGSEPIPVDGASILLRYPDGSSEAIQAVIDDSEVRAELQPSSPGVYGIDLFLRAILPDGRVVERATYLALEAFTNPPVLRP